MMTTCVITAAADTQALTLPPRPVPAWRGDPDPIWMVGDFSAPTNWNAHIRVIPTCAYRPG
jgi:hypothetical protein